MPWYSKYNFQNVKSMSANNRFTEDDTFRILSRPSIDEMIMIHNKWWYTNPSKDKRQRIPFMEQYGWTWEEFVRRVGVKAGNHFW